MARKKGLGIPGLSFSLNRALGISSTKAKISRSIGVPLTRQGRQRKFGAAAGCLLPVVATLLIVLGIVIFFV